MDSGESGQSGQPVTNPVDMEVENSQGRDSVTLQLLVLKGIHVLEKPMRSSPVTLLLVLEVDSVTRTLTVLQVSSVERTTAGTSDQVLNHLLIAALNQVKDILFII